MSKQRSVEHQQPRLVRSVIRLVATVSVVVTAFLVIQKPTEAADVIVYKSPTCGCCAKWINHLEDNGFTVEVQDRQDLQPVKRRFGIPRHLQSCHTAQVGGYVIEGHVPADDIKRMLTEKPAIGGLAVPGMPMGSPGMEGPRKDPYDVLAFDAEGSLTVYSSH